MDEMRKAVGRFGISGKTQTQPMAQLSDGLRSRVVFAWLVRALRTVCDRVKPVCAWTAACLCCGLCASGVLPCSIDRGAWRMKSQCQLPGIWVLAFLAKRRLCALRRSAEIARCYADAQAYKTPHLLLLDEPTNHLVRGFGSRVPLFVP